MFKKIRMFFARSFKRKLILFIMSVGFLTTISLFLFLMNNFNSITEFALEQNTIGMEETVKDYLTKIQSSASNYHYGTSEAAR